MKNPVKAEMGTSLLCVRDGFHRCAELRKSERIDLADEDEEEEGGEEDLEELPGPDYPHPPYRE